MNADKAQVEAKITEAIEVAQADPDNGAEESIMYAVDVIKRTLEIPCTYEYCGGFDSPGYRIMCYAIAYVTKAGELGIYTYAHELY